MNKRRIGAEKERLAWEFLKRQGVQMLESNYRTRFGEIDLIGIQDKTLVFFEVKYRKTAQFGYPQEAVDKRKQTVICRVSDQYCMEKRGQLRGVSAIRYDVIAILGTHITWIPNAFDYHGKRWN